ncbi:MAG: KTSC domain-containing protein [Betaproteobacteria bacterium]|nr:KTSC domain-containing protein [Betaproteobacteria bacterium]
MDTKTFTIGRIQRAEYEPRDRQLVLHFQDGSLRRYQSVPNEVFRRFCNAPNPTTYWEDRIAEEYPQARGKSSADAETAQKKLDGLFGE